MKPSPVYYPSGQLRIEVENDIIICKLGNVRISGITEYLKFMGDVGDFAKLLRTGKLVADISDLKNYDISIRAAAVKNLDELILKKAPYFLVAVIKGNSIFENLSMQTSITVAKPLSRKFLDGKLFDTRAEAIHWLESFEIPKEFQKS